MNNKLSITFLYPSKKIGGAQLLFVRLARELAQFDDMTVNLVDYPGGYLESQLLNDKKVNIIHYARGKATIDAGTLVITPLSNLGDLRYMLKGDLREINVLFWCIHPEALKHILFEKGRKLIGSKEEAKDLIAALSVSGNIVYMDEVTYKATMVDASRTFAPVYMPIPLEIPELPPQRGTGTASGSLNICWLGRISYDKINSICKIADEIKSVKGNRQITLHIIGGGDKLDDLKAYLEASGISYVLVGVLEKEALAGYLLSNIDLGVSMGTSCIEFAALKIPVCIIDYSLSKLPAVVKYNWLYETENFTLGGHVETVPPRNHTFAELLEQVDTDPQLGEKGYEYAYKHHNLKKVTAKLHDYCYNLPAINWKEVSRVEGTLNPFLYRVIYGAFRKLVEFKNR